MLGIDCVVGEALSCGIISRKAVRILQVPKVQCCVHRKNSLEWLEQILVSGNNSLL
jgi:hypothetical protein